MPGSRRKLSVGERSLLWAQSSGICGYPGCSAPLVLPNGHGYTVVGEGAHIVGHSPGGPRYDPSASSEFVDSVENQILLCRLHHTLVDAAPDTYSQGTMQEWKEEQRNRIDTRRLDMALLSPPAPALDYRERQALQAEVRSLISQDSSVVLKGISGSGKSQLALRVLELEQETRTIQWWIRSTDRESIQAGLASMADLLGISPSTYLGNEQAAALVLRRLGEMSGWLLVYDSADNPHDLEGLLPAGGAVLVTTQNDAWHTIGTEVAMTPVDRELAAAIFSKKGLNSLDTQQIDEIIDECSGLILAVTQCANMMKTTGMSATKFVNLLRTRKLDILGRGEASTHASAQASIELVIDRLSVQARDLLHTICTLALAPIPLGAHPWSLADDVPLKQEHLAMEDSIVELRRYSLLQRAGDVITVHDLVRTVARSTMGGRSQLMALMGAVGLIVDQVPAYTGDTANWARMELLAPHLHELSSALKSSGFPAATWAWMINKLEPYADGAGERATTEAVLDRAVDALRGDCSVEGRAALGSLLTNAANREIAAGNYAEAEPSLIEAIGLKEEVYESDADAYLIGISKASLAVVRALSGDVASARRLHREALEMYRRSQNSRGIIDALTDLAMLDADEGDYDSARRGLLQAVEIPTDSEEAMSVAIRARRLFADVLVELEVFSDAVRIAAGAVRLAKSGGVDIAELGFSYCAQGRALCQMGLFSAGIARQRRGVLLLTEILGDQSVPVAREVGNIGASLMRASRLDEAHLELESSLDSLRRLLPAGHGSLAVAERLLDHCQEMIHLARAGRLLR